MAAALLVLLGTAVGVVLARRGAVELEKWRRREETMRLLRWAAELAVDHDAGRRRVGNAALEALVDSPLVDRRDIPLVGHVATAAWAYAEEEADEEKRWQ